MTRGSTTINSLLNDRSRILPCAAAPVPKRLTSLPASWARAPASLLFVLGRGDSRQGKKVQGLWKQTYCEHTHSPSIGGGLDAQDLVRFPMRFRAEVCSVRHDVDLRRDGDFIPYDMDVDVIVMGPDRRVFTSRIVPITRLLKASEHIARGVPNGPDLLMTAQGASATAACGQC